MEKTYTIVKEQFNGDKVYIDYTKFKGFKVKPRNNVKYDGIKVNSLVILKPSFIEKLLKKKVCYNWVQAQVVLTKGLTISPKKG